MLITLRSGHGRSPEVDILRRATPQTQARKRLIWHVLHGAPLGRPGPRRVPGAHLQLQRRSRSEWRPRCAQPRQPPMARWRHICASGGVARCAMQERRQTRSPLRTRCESENRRGARLQRGDVVMAGGGSATRPPRYHINRWDMRDLVEEFERFDTDDSKCLSRPVATPRPLTRFSSHLR